MDINEFREFLQTHQDAYAAWGRFVSDQCAALNVPCIVEAVEVQYGNLEQQRPPGFNPGGSREPNQ